MAQDKTDAVEQGEPRQYKARLNIALAVGPNTRSSETNEAAPNPSVNGSKLAPANQVAVRIAPTRLSPQNSI